MNYSSLSIVNLADLKDKVVVVFGGSRAVGSNINKKAELQSQLNGCDSMINSGIIW